MQEANVVCVCVWMCVYMCDLVGQGLVIVKFTGEEAGPKNR